MANPGIVDVASQPSRSATPSPSARAQGAATLIGSSAILMWSLLALFTAASGAVPPFQLAAMTFAVGALVGFAWIAAGRRWRDLRQPWPVWTVGILGLFGYHALYFTALRNAPPVEAGVDRKVVRLGEGVGCVGTGDDGGG